MQTLDEFTRQKEQGLKDLLFHSGKAVCLVNSLTLYRIITAPLLIALVAGGNTSLFRWLLLASFLTDALDGFLARKFNAGTKLGAKLDSLGDILTYVVALFGMILTHPEFFQQEWLLIATLLGLNFLQMFLAFRKYGKISSFHTYLAKASAVLLSVFLLSSFFTDSVFIILFYIACVATILELVEEIILVFVLPEWKNDVKGLYWVLNNK